MGSHTLEIGKYVGITLLSSVKFLFSPFAARGLHLTFLESILSTTAGGILGILVFGLIGELISDKWSVIVAFFLSVFTSRTKIEAIRHSKRKFKPMTRFIVKVKRRLGLFGLAFLTPCLISIPFGAIACMSFFSHRRKDAFIYLFLSLTFWTLVLNAGAHWKELFHMFR